LRGQRSRKPIGFRLWVVHNAGLMGIPIPSVITKAIDILKKESEKANTN